MATNNAVNTSLSGQTGTGSFVGATSPTLVTPTLGVASATSINFGGSALGNYVATTSWTPVFTFATPGNLSVAYATQIGNYVRIGSTVYFNLSLTCTPTFTTSSGALNITGLPFTTATGVGTVQGPATVGIVTFDAGYTHTNLSIGANSNIILIVESGSTKAAAAFTTANFFSATQVQIIASGTIFI